MRRPFLVLIALSIFGCSESSRAPFGGGRVQVCIVSENAPIVAEDENGNISIPLTAANDNFDFANAQGVRTCDLSTTSHLVSVMYNDLFGLVQIGLSFFDREGVESPLKSEVSANSGIALLGTDQRGATRVELFDDVGLISAAQTHSGLATEEPEVSRGADTAERATDCGTQIESEFVVTHDNGEATLRGGNSVVVSYGESGYMFSAGSGIYAKDWICSDPPSELSWVLQRVEN